MIIRRKTFQAGDDLAETWISDSGGNRLSGTALARFFRKSRKFEQWKPETSSTGSGVTEKHFSPQELSIAWGVSAEKIRCLFRKEPGVLRLPSGQVGNGKRSYITMKIPESVAIRVHRRLSAIPQ